MDEYLEWHEAFWEMELRVVSAIRNEVGASRSLEDVFEYFRLRASVGIYPKVIPVSSALFELIQQFPGIACIANEHHFVFEEIFYKDRLRPALHYMGKVETLNFKEQVAHRRSALGEYLKQKMSDQPQSPTAGATQGFFNLWSKS